jgi:hypothetical protein
MHVKVDIENYSGSMFIKMKLSIENCASNDLTLFSLI